MLLVAISVSYNDFKSLSGTDLATNNIILVNGNIIRDIKNVLTQ